MKVFKVPDVLLVNKKPINIVYYRNENPVEKSRVLFTQNVISFIVSGEKEIYLSTEKPIKVREKVALINVSNCLMSERKTEFEKPYSALLLFFDDSVLLDFIRKHSLHREYGRREKRLNVSVVSNDVYLKSYRDFMISVASGKLLSERLKIVKLEELFIYLMENYPEAIAVFFDKKIINEGQMKFQAIIEYNKLENLSIEELAFLCNMSVATFRRYFKKYYDTSPQKWLMNERMNYARNLLNQGKRASQIYQQLGYSNLTNFIRAYRKYFLRDKSDMSD